MNTVHLHTLEGYRPLGRISEVDRYVLERGSEQASVAASVGGLVVSADEMEQMALMEQQEIQAEQGAAPYVNDLVERVELVGRNSLCAERLARTALTDLFRDRYGVAIDELTQNGPSALRMYGGLYPPTLGTGVDLGIDYQTHRESGAETFWRLGINATYGIVNMSCLSGPLEGQGNIAFISGVQEALVADVQLLVDAAAQG